MSDKKISQLTDLPAASVAPSNDVLAIVDTNLTETKKITAKALVDGALNAQTADAVVYLNNSKEAVATSSLTFNGTVLSTTTVDATNVEVTNVKAKDGTAAIAIADSTGKVTISTEFAADNININGNAITSTNTNGNIALTPNGTGEVDISKVDIDSGAIDGTTIGGSSAAAGTFTNVIATTITADYVYANNIANVGSFTWDTNTSSPAAATSVGSRVITPIHAGMRRCVINDSGVVQYYLDPSDSTKKADGTSANIDGTDGQVMVEIPKFYARREVSGTYVTWSISPVALPGFTLHPAFTKNGSTVDFRYCGAYDACVYDVSASAYISGQNYDNNSGAGNGVAVDVTASTGDVLASVSGVYPMVGLTRAEFRTIAANRGAGWRQLDFTLWSAIQLLYLVEYQTFYSQNVLGNGNTATTYATTAGDPTQAGNGGSEAGKSNALGNASTNTTSGASSASRGVAYMSYRGIENFYGNEWNWTDGVIVNPDGAVSADQGDWWFTNNSADFSDSVKTNMTQITAAAATGSGVWMTALVSSDNFFVPAASSGGSSSTYITDQFFNSTSADRVVRVGGGADDGAAAGAFGVRAADDSSRRVRVLGGRLAF